LAVQTSIRLSARAESPVTRRQLRGIGGVFALLALSTFVRWPTFLRTVIDWDESLYLMMADAWRRGHVPYVTLWDHKPVGTYLLFLAAMEVLGRSVIPARVLTVVFVAGSALMVRSLVLTCTGRRDVAVAAAVAYPSYSIVLEGTAANAEHFFIAFDLAGALLLAQVHCERPEGWGRWLRIFLSGLAFGVALQIKYIAIFEIAFMLACFAWCELRRHPGRGLAGLCTEVLAIGFLMSAPTAIAGAYFWSLGFWADFVDANFLANLRHVRPTWLQILSYGPVGVLHWAKWTLPLWIVPAVASVARLIRRDVIARFSGFEWLLVGWVGVGLLEAAATTKFYGHYYLVTLPPLCMLAMSVALTNSLSLAKHPIYVGLLFSIAPVALLTATRYAGWIRERLNGELDPPTRIANFVRARVPPQEEIFVVDDQPIIYFLSGFDPPTRYAFPLFLIDPHFSVVARVSYRSEFERILGRRPRCLVFGRLHRNERADEMRGMLGNDYSLERSFGDSEVVCRK
jgi:4-amino-4-deoxy-L-arabinose transferase-like glycosyltransferase